MIESHNNPPLRHAQVVSCEKSRKNGAKYDIGGEPFTRKDDIRRRAQGILHATPDGNLISPEDFRFMHALLERHPDAEEKFGCGVVAFRVIHNLLPYSHRGFRLVRADGSEIDFSYNACVYQPSHLQGLRTALRREVKVQIDAARREAFRSADRIVCPLSGAQFSEHEAEVDHVVPATFVRLVSDFFSEYFIDPTSVTWIGRPEGLSDKCLVHRGVAELWQDYHRAHAVLRVLSRQGHAMTLRKGDI